MFAWPCYSAEGASPLLLVQQTGTSVGKLEQFYGSVLTFLFTKEITETKGQANSPKFGNKEYLFVFS